MPPARPLLAARVGLAVLALLAGVVGLAGCGHSGSVGAVGSTAGPVSTVGLPPTAAGPPAQAPISPTPRARASGPAGDCPALVAAGPNATFAAVDYVDIVVWGGVTYVGRGAVSWTSAAPTRVRDADVGPMVFTVRCAFSTLNDLTHLQPPPLGDGDAAFLAAGTPVNELRGWPRSCRLVARDRAGELVVYRALDPAVTTTATLLPCAGPPGRAVTVPPPPPSPSG